MKRALAFLCVVSLLGCYPPGRHNKPPPVKPDQTTGSGMNIFIKDDGPPLSIADMVFLDAQKKGVEKCLGKSVPPGDVTVKIVKPIFPNSARPSILCGDGRYAQGCAHIKTKTVRLIRSMMREKAPNYENVTTTWHELGHIARGKKGHIGRCGL